MSAKYAATPKMFAQKMMHGVMPASFFPTPGLSRDLRPLDWARRVDPGLPGVPNLHRVTEDLYRAAQPDPDGFRALQGLGVRSVVSLRQTLEDGPLARNTGLALSRVPMKSRFVAEKNGARVVQAMRDVHCALQSGPVLVHCHHGADRTGLICALWRILYQGWSRQSAIDELIEGGYGFHPIWFNIPRYLREVNLIDLRDRIGA